LILRDVSGCPFAIVVAFGALVVVPALAKENRDTHFTFMRTATKALETKSATRKRRVRVSKACRSVVRADLPPLKKSSVLYGLDDAIGAVSIGGPSSKADRRRVLRVRIHADNHR
jgi:hypothetical protein